MPEERNLIRSVVLRFAQKYIAGYTASSALEEARENSRRGINTTITFLNEGASSPVKARYNANAYVQLAKQASRLNLSADISVRLSQIGLGINGGAVLDRCLDDILAASSSDTYRVWLEAERALRMDELFEIYRRCRQRSHNVGLEVPVWYQLEVDVIKKQLRKNDIVKLTSYSYAQDTSDGEVIGAMAAQAGEGKPKGAKVDGRKPLTKNYSDLYISSIGKLLQAGINVVVLDHKEEVIAKLAGFSKEYKKSLIFELPLGYNKGWLAKFMKMKINLSVYAPYGKDWTPYIVNKLTARHDRVRDIAARVLDGSAEEVIEGGAHG